MAKILDSCVSCTNAHLLWIVPLLKDEPQKDCEGWQAHLRLAMDKTTAVAMDIAMARQQQAMVVTVAMARQLIFMIYSMHWI